MRHAISKDTNVQVKKGRHAGRVGVVEKIYRRRPFPYYIRIGTDVLTYNAHEIRAI